MVSVNDIINLVILLFLSGFFSGSEVALVSIPEIKVRQMVSKKKFGATYVKKLKDDPQRMLATILLGNNVVNIAASAMTTSIVIETFHSNAVGIATGIMTFLILIFGEITPKSMSSANNLVVSRLVAGPIWMMSVVLYPIIKMLEFFINIIPKIFGLDIKAKAVTEEDILGMVSLAQEKGSLKGPQEAWIKNIFQFDDITVGEIAVPRNDIVSIKSISTVKETIEVMNRKKRQRLPVYENSKDNIVGVIYIKKLLNYVGKENVVITNIMDEAFFVPETKKLSQLFRSFQEKREHMAVVVDEYGSLSGLVTMENLLEAIVGDITDDINDTGKIRKIDENSWCVLGDIEVNDLRKKLGLDIKKKSYNTISGYLMESMGKIPNEGDEFSTEKITFLIKEMEGHRISKVIIERK